MYGKNGGCVSLESTSRLSRSRASTSLGDWRNDVSGAAQSRSLLPSANEDLVPTRRSLAQLGELQQRLWEPWPACLPDVLTSANTAMPRTRLLQRLPAGPQRIKSKTKQNADRHSRLLLRNKSLNSWVSSGPLSILRGSSLAISAHVISQADDICTLARLPRNRL